MARVLGIGGIFFKARNPAALGAWYAENLGFEINPGFGGSVFLPADLPAGGYTVWTPFDADTDYFQPSPQSYMFNLVVDDLDAALAQVKAGGAELIGEPEKGDYGDFGWFIDPEGNKVELWQPPASLPEG